MLRLFTRSLTPEISKYLPRNAWEKSWVFLNGGLLPVTLAPPASNKRLNPGWRDLSTHRSTTQPLKAPQEYVPWPVTEEAYIQDEKKII